MSDTTPTLTEIALALNWPSHAIDKVAQAVASKVHLVNPRVVLPLIQNDCVLVPPYPEEKQNAESETPRDRANGDFFLWAAMVVFWSHNVHTQKSASAQLNFVQKQPERFHSYWAGTAANILGPSSKALFVECLRRGFHTSALEISWREHREFWGELGDLIPVEEFPIWPATSRTTVLEMLPTSKNEAFRYAITKSLFNDPDAQLRDQVRSKIAKGFLPAMRPGTEDLYPPLDTPEELAITRGLWNDLQRVRMPDSLRDLEPEKFVNMAGLDEVTRRNIRLKMDDSPDASPSMLSFCIMALDFVLNTHRGPDRQYLAQLHNVATRVRRSFKIQ